MRHKVTVARQLSSWRYMIREISHFSDWELAGDGRWSRGGYRAGHGFVAKIDPQVHIRTRPHERWKASPRRFGDCSSRTATRGRYPIDTACDSPSCLRTLAGKTGTPPLVDEGFAGVFGYRGLPPQNLGIQESSTSVPLFVCLPRGHSTRPRQDRQEPNAAIRKKKCGIRWRSALGGPEAQFEVLTRSLGIQKKTERLSRCTSVSPAGILRDGGHPGKSGTPRIQQEKCGIRWRSAPSGEDGC
jgi:hypothetical protein